MSQLGWLSLMSQLGWLSLMSILGHDSRSTSTHTCDTCDTCDTGVTGLSNDCDARPMIDIRATTEFSSRELADPVAVSEWW